MDNNFKIKEISERLIKTDISDKRDLSKEPFQNQEFSKKEKSEFFKILEEKFNNGNECQNQEKPKIKRK